MEENTQTNYITKEFPQTTAADSERDTATLPKNYLKDDLSLEQITTMIQQNSAVLAAEPLFQEILSEMQLGNWEVVSNKVNELKKHYPESPELEMLGSEVALRTDFDEQWSDKVKGKQSFFSPVKLAVRLAPFALILALLGGGFYYAQQARLFSTEVNSQQANVAQAQEHLAAGRFAEALALFEEILGNEPDNEIAKQGLAEATRQLDLQNQYEDGLADYRAEKLAAAAVTFTGLAETAPGYRDVDSLLSQITLAISTEETFEAAGTAYSQSQWAMAIALYEKLKSRNGQYEAETVQANLVDSYLNEALAIVALSPEQGADVDQAQTYFRKVLKLELNQPVAKENSEILSDYNRGISEIGAQNYRGAIQTFERIDTTHPGYLNGHITQKLYQLYMDAGTRAEETNDLLTAHSFYQKAVAPNVADRTEAQEKLRIASIALTPTATPTATPTSTPSPTPTFVPTQPAVRLAPAAAAQPTTPPPTATPIPPTMASFHGWILFRSNRDGGSRFYVMQTNGADVQPAPAEAREQYQVLYDNEKWSPDRNAELIIPKEKSGGGSQHNIYKIRHDLPENWTRKFRMTDFPGATYDPVWDPTNKRIAFVSNHTGGDEIWVMGTEGQDPKQLTKNSWEWDKHPTWSPNGQELFFYSNRTGLSQIWVMNPDGGNLRQISDGQYEDWDPVIIR